MRSPDYYSCLALAALTFGVWPLLLWLLWPRKGGDPVATPTPTTIDDVKNSATAMVAAVTAFEAADTQAATDAQAAEVADSTAHASQAGSDAAKSAMLAARDTLDATVAAFVAGT